MFRSCSALGRGPIHGLTIGAVSLEVLQQLNLLLCLGLPQRDALDRYHSGLASLLPSTWLLFQTSLQHSSHFRKGLENHSFEDIAFKLSGSSRLVTPVICCSPKPYPSFLSNFMDFLANFSVTSLFIHLLSDFNFHIDNNRSKPLDLLNRFNIISQFPHPHPRSYPGSGLNYRNHNLKPLLP